MPALLIGSISTLVDTSELQRLAFNRAFEQHGLDWQWDQSDYQQMLTGNGGAGRISDYAEQRGEQVDAAAVHATKSEIFRDLLGQQQLTVRPGVVETLDAARGAGWRLGLVTTTAMDNVTALLGSVEALSVEDFDLITDVETVENPKPSPEVYLRVLAELDADANTCVAVEDNVGGVRSATEAGIACLAFPNANTAAHDFGSAQVVSTLDFDDVRGAVEQDA